MKEAVDYYITGKMSFPLTDQYFISLDNPEYLNHEVDAEYYGRCQVGDVITLYRAPLSKYFFEMNGNFTLL